MSSLGEGDIFKFDAQYLYLWQNWDAPLAIDLKLRMLILEPGRTFKGAHGRETARFAINNCYLLRHKHRLYAGSINPRARAGAGNLFSG